MRIELVIDELVLHGFDARHRHTVGDAVTSELARLARTHASELGRRQSMEVTRIDGGAFETSAGAPARAGAGIANSVFSALRKGAS
jgi:hypothetical protein